MVLPSPIIAPALASPAVRHGFFTRAGGVSEGPFASLNCGFGSGDDLEKVAENRRRAVAEAVGDGAILVTGHQSHTADAVVVKTGWAPGDAPVADGLVTDRPGIALGVLAADCAPILMADGDAGVIGAAHAGWRGAFDGILEATIERMEALGAERARVIAAIGPCIGPDSYEVGPEFRVRFLEADAGTEDLFRPALRPGHAMFDLAGYVRRRLSAAGLGYIAATGGDTCADPARFFSYRRTVLEGGRAYGRGLSLIALHG
jgi:YfiH family protein